MRDFFYGYKKWGVIYGRNQEEIHGRSAHGSAPDQGKDAIVADEVELVGTTRAFDKAFLNGEGKEEAASPPKKEANPASLRSAAPSKGRGSRGHSLLPMEGGAPKGRRLDGGSGMKERGEIVSSASLYESTLSTAIPISSERIHACVEKQYPRQSLPRVGKVANKASRIGFCRYEREGRSSQVCHYTRAPERRRKRKPTPPRCARQPLPKEGARVDTPSFLWKEEPRRGGGWMGEAG